MARAKTRHFDIELGQMESSVELQDFYNWANEHYFGNELPYVRVVWYKQKRVHCYGSTVRIKGAKFCHYICINPVFKYWMDTAFTTILHEMIHVKFGNRWHHGPKFKKELRRLTKMGAFDQYL